MELGDAAWNCLIRDGGERLGVQVSDAQLALLAAHATELLRWNRKTNLTAITNPEEIAVKHVLDAFAALPVLPLHAALLDIGSGGGYPGLVLKIMRPELTVLLIDSIRKKVSFLSHVIRMLGVSNIAALYTRAETLANDSRDKPAFNVIVCRALCELSAFVSMSLPLLAPGGKLIAYKGRFSETQAELARLAPFFEHANPDMLLMDDQRLALSLETYQLPFIDSERTLAIFQRRD
ncbi:MAG: 16S rRNA (guanine(527)-N(7))-methyltransferase RsmG [Desulfobacterales bacterium]|jgi:16S rRNA (guanine527-N7)-methyltransferase|nr:16S rRNA (guanine(527)-N(7))-methyltransferase RsmG [Desulfobacterales bacterium]